jgi:streptomycin 6-kinase
MAAPGGCRAVLKVNFPEPESEHEAEALRNWDGDGAVRLIEHDPDRGALLVERCDPGAQLWSLPEEEANRIAGGVLGRLWRRPPDPHPFRLLADEAARWADEIPAKWRHFGRPLERLLIEEVVEFLCEVGPAQGEAVLLHQDFHGGNVLRSQRGWLAIDPKPLVGEREFDPGWLLSDRLEELKLDPACAVCDAGSASSRPSSGSTERILGWGIAHSLAWGSWKGDWDDELVALVGWLAEAR